jgi:methionine-rich copper-binding protein CopC
VRLASALGRVRVAVSSLVGVALVDAQPLLVESTPRSGEAVGNPTRLHLRFSERIEKRRSTVMLVGGPRNTRIWLFESMPEAGPEALLFVLPRVEPGTYRAEWKVLSLDGPAIEGTVTFSVVSDVSAPPR